MSFLWLCETKVPGKSKVMLLEANRFIVCIKTENIYIEIAKDV